MSSEVTRLAGGAALPPSIAARVHEAVAILRAKKLALDAGVSRAEVDAYVWAAEVQSSAELAA